MNEDNRQDAVVRCLKAGYRLDPLQPYSGTLFKVVLKRVRVDEGRRQQSERRRKEAHEGINHERIDPEKRYVRGIDDPVHNAELREERERLLTAISALPQRQCHIICECDLHGVPICDYAAKLGETESTIRSQRYRALISLRKRLK